MPIRALIGLLRQVPLRQRSLLFFSMLFSGITESVGILLLVPLLNVIQNDPRTHSALVQALLKGLSSLGIPPTPGGILGFFLLLLIARSALLYLRETVSVHVQHETVDRLRDRCFDAVLRAEWRWIAAGRSSDHANLLITDVSRVGVGLNFGLAFLVSALTIFAYLCAAFALSWTMAALAIVSCGAVIVALAGQRRQVMSLGESLGRANRAMQATVQESLSGIKLTKILGNERRHLNLFQETMSRLRQQQVSFMTATGRARALYQTLGATVLVAYLYVGLTAFRTPVAELLVLVLIFGRLIPLLSTSQQQYHHWLHALPALRETERLLVEADAVREPAAPMPTRPWAIERGVRLENVTLRYADRNRAALQNISVTFPARTTTAIMGASGAGKSTLADVLMGLLTPDSGTFWVDDAPVEGEARARWRHAVAYVPQDTFLFHDTIRSNLSWARASASDDELRQALQRAAAGFVFDLPKGLDTVVGDGGVRLSGGERQRLALARALLNKPSLLILDEATSALDMENEARVRKAVENLHGDLTVVIIGHRLPTLEHADQVLVMSDGNIAAQGAWGEVRQHMESVV